MNELGEIPFTRYLYITILLTNVEQSLYLSIVRVLGLKKSRTTRQKSGLSLPFCFSIGFYTTNHTCRVFPEKGYSFLGVCLKWLAIFLKGGQPTQFFF